MPVIEVSGPNPFARCRDAPPMPQPTSSTRVGVPSAHPAQMAISSTNRAWPRRSPSPCTRGACPRLARDPRRCSIRDGCVRPSNTRGSAPRSRRRTRARRWCRRSTGDRGVEVAFYPGVGPTDGQTRERRLSHSDELGGADGGRGEKCADGREVGTRKDGRGGDGAHLECGRSRGGGRARDAVRRKRRARELVKRQAMGLGRGVDGRQTCCDRALARRARPRRRCAAR